MKIIDAGSMGPAILGVARPVLLLPASMLAGLSPDCLEAILAHELAHVRRHDYLINLVQMVVEALLFFNPAVWWIGKQIRQEREACCDALAVTATGKAVRYVETLADWLDRSMPRPASAVAWAAPGRGGALDRIRRLLVAGYKPELRASWPVVFGGVCLSTLALGLLGSGTQLAVAFTARCIPAEQIKRLTQEEKEFRDGSAAQGWGGHDLREIRTADGKPVPKILRGWTECNSARESTYPVSSYPNRPIIPTAQRGIFRSRSNMARAGWFFGVMATHFFFGSASDIDKPAVTGLEVVLERGFTARVKVVNEEGESVSNAALRAMVETHPGSRNGSNFWENQRSNAQGELVLERPRAAPYFLKIEAAGYQPLESGATLLQPDKTITLVLVKARPTDGIVVSPEGRPIVGATIRKTVEADPWLHYDWRSWSHPCDNRKRWSVPARFPCRPA